MFRVPADPKQPTFDETFKVGFGRWLTSNAADRKEWARRRNAAAGILNRDGKLADFNIPPVVDENAFDKFTLAPDSIRRGLTDNRPLTGVTATVGELQRKKGRKTVAAARILTGSVAATAGALGRIGAKTLTITGPDFEWTAEVPAHKVEQATSFAERVNAAARQHG